MSIGEAYPAGDAGRGKTDGRYEEQRSQVNVIAQRRKSLLNQDESSSGAQAVGNNKVGGTTH